MARVKAQNDTSDIGMTPGDWFVPIIVYTVDRLSVAYRKKIHS